MDGAELRVVKMLVEADLTGSSLWVEDSAGMLPIEVAKEVQDHSDYEYKYSGGEMIRRPGWIAEVFLERKEQNSPEIIQILEDAMSTGGQRIPYKHKV